MTEVIKKEGPDALLATLGGQVGLNMAVDLSEAGVLEKYGVELLGSSLHAIKHAEDRELFKRAMNEIHQPVPESGIFDELEPAVTFADKIGYPVIIRPAYTLGGTGGGIAHDRYEMEEISNRGIKLSPINQILVERSVAGWKEVEFEVMRDSADNCLCYGKYRSCRRPYRRLHRCGADTDTNRWSVPNVAYRFFRYYSLSPN